MGYGGEGPAPPLPDSLRAQLAMKYVELYERLTGLAFKPGGATPDVPPDARLAGRLAEFAPL